MVSPYIQSKADEDFSKARNKALFNDISHLLNPEEATLISFSDIRKLLKPEGEVYKGMMPVPVNLIVGSEGRYKDFDNHFFPKSNHLKERWENIDIAHYQDIALPPITVYEVGGLYFVRDGNHRVSVAKSKGFEMIDADVISIQSEIKLKSGSSREDILKQVIKYEKGMFYAETVFGDITDYWCLNFTTCGMYDLIYNHILIHKYYINMDKEKEIPFEEAVLSWFKNVYMPVIQSIRRNNVMHYFPKRTESDLYVFVIKYWDALKKRFGDYFSLDEAAKTFKKVYGKTFFDTIRNFFEKIRMKNAK